MHQIEVLKSTRMILFSLCTREDSQKIFVSVSSVLRVSFVTLQELEAGLSGSLYVNGRPFSQVLGSTSRKVRATCERGTGCLESPFGVSRTAYNVSCVMGRELSLSKLCMSRQNKFIVFAHIQGTCPFNQSPTLSVTENIQAAWPRY